MGVSPLITATLGLLHPGSSLSLFTLYAALSSFEPTPQRRGGARTMMQLGEKGFLTSSPLLPSISNFKNFS